MSKYQDADMLWNEYQAHYAVGPISFSDYLAVRENVEKAAAWDLAYLILGRWLVNENRMKMAAKSADVLAQTYLELQKGADPGALKDKLWQDLLTSWYVSDESDNDA